MRKEYRILLIRLALVTTFSCAVATQSAWFVPRCYATTSEAQQEADQKVSLSAEKIIEILRQEPGLLLLLVKRMLIQKAYEQGRILEASDLTDDALFRLLREDDVVRALATRQVENRFYVRAKPTRQEIERKRTELDDDQNQASEQERPGQKPPASNQVQRTNRQDDAYGSERPRDGENQGRSRPGTQPPLQPDREPEISLPRNPARAVDRAELEQNPNIFENMGSDASRMARIHPEELAGLLSVTSRAPTQPSESSSWPRQDSRLPARTGSATVGGSTIDLWTACRFQQSKPACGLIARRCLALPGLTSLPSFATALIPTTTYPRCMTSTARFHDVHRNWSVSGWPFFAMELETWMICPWTFPLVRNTCSAPPARFPPQAQGC